MTDRIVLLAILVCLLGGCVNSPDRPVSASTATLGQILTRDSQDVQIGQLSFEPSREHLADYVTIDSRTTVLPARGLSLREASERFSTELSAQFSEVVNAALNLKSIDTGQSTLTWSGAEVVRVDLKQLRDRLQAVEDQNRDTLDDLRSLPNAIVVCEALRVRNLRLHAKSVEGQGAQLEAELKNLIQGKLNGRARLARSEGAQFEDELSSLGDGAVVVAKATLPLRDLLPQQTKVYAVRLTWVARDHSGPLTVRGWLPERNLRVPFFDRGDAFVLSTKNGHAVRTETVTEAELEQFRFELASEGGRTVQTEVLSVDPPAAIGDIAIPPGPGAPIQMNLATNPHDPDTKRPRKADVYYTVTRVR